MTPRKRDPLEDDFNDGEDDEDGSKLVRFARLSLDLKQVNKQLTDISADLRDAKKAAETEREENRRRFESNSEQTRKQIQDMGQTFATKKELEEVDARNKPTRDALAKINWIVITAVILALLGLVLVNRGGL